VTKRAPGVEMTLLRSNFTVERSVVGGADFFGIMYKVPADGEVNALGIHFVGTFRGNEASIRFMKVRWELVVKDISHGIQA
jgi:hypothetical protein